MKGRKQRNGKRGPRGWKTGCIADVKGATKCATRHYKCDLNMTMNFLFDYDLNINYDLKAATTQVVLAR